MTKRKGLKIAAFLVALALIIGIGIFASALVGNPVSKMLATRTAEKHLAETYADTDFYIERVGYDFKAGCYYAHIKSPTSIDSHFTLYLNMDGSLAKDTYEDVTKGYTTADRLNREYRELTDSVLESPSFPYSSNISFGDLEFTSKDYDPAMSDEIPSYALFIEDLELDRLYDIPDLGAQAGHLILYVDDDTVTIERAAEIMLDIKRLMDEGGAPFYAIDFVLQYPLPDGDTPRPDVAIRARNFLYTDIYEEGMLERVTKANEETIAYYKKLDEEKEAEQ